VKYAFIKQSLGRYPVRVCCDVLGVSRSGYYDARSRPISPRRQRRAALAAEVRAAHEASRGLYGSPRVYQVLKAREVEVSENTVAKIMHEEGVCAAKKAAFVPGTTDSAHDKPIAENRLDRDFTAQAPDRKWVADITYIPTAAGWLYLAVMLDLCSRKVVGWAMADHLRAGLVIDALAMAIHRRRPAAGLLHHSDRGVQYACEDYRGLLEASGIVVSMSGKGNCWDNAVMESFFATLKKELIHHAEYADHEEAKRSIFEYIEVFYNRQRLHSTLGYRSPEAFEADLA
jgi:transposase InsO family protein